MHRFQAPRIATAADLPGQAEQGDVQAVVAFGSFFFLRLIRNTSASDAELVGFYSTDPSSYLFA